MARRSQRRQLALEDGTGDSEELCISMIQEHVGVLVQDLGQLRANASNA